MRFFLLTLVALLFAGRVGAQYYNADEGKSFRYAEYDASGKVVGHSVYLNKRVEGSGRNLRIVQELTTSSINKKGKEKTNRPGESVIEVEDGVATQRVDAKAKHGAMKMTMTGPYCVLPYTLHVGDRLEPFAVKAKMTVVFISEEGTMSFRRRTVTGRETVQVPAGEFDCFRIEEEADLELGPINLDLFGHHAEEESKNKGTTTQLKRILWVARNVGIVKMLEYDKDGRQDNDMRLEAIH